MSEQKEKNKKKEKQTEKTRAKEIWLAGLGALSAVEEEGNKLFRSLVDRGTNFEKKRVDQINEMKEGVSDRLKNVENRVEDSFDKAEETVGKNINSIVSGIGIPTRREVQELSEKVDKLTVKLEKLLADKSAESGKKAKGNSSKST